MSYLYGLETLIQKYQVKGQEGRQLMTPNAENLFEVVHKKELLNKEKELFIREHLFKERGGFEFNKNKGLPDIRAYNKHLPSVLREGDETGNQIEEENEIGEIASDITDISSVSITNEEKEIFEKERSKIEATIKSGLRGKNSAKKAELIQSMSGGKGIPVFSYSKSENLKDILENAPIRQPDFDDDGDDEKSDGSGDPSENVVNSFKLAPGVKPAETEEQKKEKQKISLTDRQKEEIKKIVGTEDFKQDTKQKQAQPIIIMDKDGNIIAKAPSKREITKLANEGIINKIKKVKISNYGVFMELEDDSVAVSVPKKYYNSLLTADEKEAEKKRKADEKSKRTKKEYADEDALRAEQRDIPAPSPLKRRTSSKIVKNE
jgi:hypothetical protein